MNHMLDATQGTTLKLKDIKPEEVILLRDVLWILKEVPCRQALVYVHLTLDFVHLFIRELFMDHLQCARYYSCHLGYINGQKSCISFSRPQ